MEYDPADVPALIEPIERGVADVVFGSRLSRRPAAAGVPLLAPRRQPVPVAPHGDPLQHDAERHGDGLQGVPHRRPAGPRPEAERLLDRARDHRPRSASRSCGSTSCRSPTTGARTRKGRRSPGETGSRRSGCSCVSESETEQPEPASSGARRRIRRHVGWVGLVVSLLFGYLAFRDVDLGELRDALARPAARLPPPRRSGSRRLAWSCERGAGNCSSSTRRARRFAPS